MMPLSTSMTLPLTRAAGMGFRHPLKRDVLYCSVSERLRESARAASEKFSRLNACAGAGVPPDAMWHVQYRSQRIAEKCLTLLQNLRRQHGGSGESGTADAPPTLLDSNGLRLQCTFNEGLADEDAFRALARDIAAQETGAVVRVEKGLKKLAQTYTQLFDPSLITALLPGVGGDVPPQWQKEMLTSHHAIMEFLRLFVSLCSSEKPTVSYADYPVHKVEIRDTSSIIVDGAAMNFNAARKAALFTLAILGTDNITVEAFARLYDNYLTGNTKFVNYSKVFAQAMQGLRKSLVHIEVVNVRPNYRKVIGLSIDSKVSSHELKKWIGGRKPKDDASG
jgi:hypothetical protein